MLASLGLGLNLDLPSPLTDDTGGHNLLVLPVSAFLGHLL
jgi:hypothetical protein